MKKAGIVKPPEELEKICPFCNGKLGAVEYLKLKTRKICKCPKCGKTIDRRHVVY